MDRLISTYFLFIITFYCSPLIAQNSSWQLVWQDEFTHGIGPDWVFETGTGANGWGNNELQYYRRENASVENGNLVITARRENFGGRSYTSARMKTQGRKSWRYGKIEARIALPSFQGSWPAFWMLGESISTVGWPSCGEIDIMEHINTDPDIHGTIHWRDHTGQRAMFGRSTGTDVTQFHIYSVEWDDKSIQWFVNGRKYNEANIENGINGTHEFHENFFILLNMAIGGNWPGFAVDNNAFPAKMYVDYVRVYQRNGGGGTAPFTRQVEAESFFAQSGVQLEPCVEGGLNVGYIETADWMAYSNINFPSTGNYLIEYRVASAVNGARLSADLQAGAIQLGEVGIPNTGGWQNWTTVSHTVYVNAGTYNFGIYAQSGGWNINWWKITKLNSSSARISSAKNLDTHDSEPLNSSTYTIFPNPAKDKLNISIKESTVYTAHILDMQGREVLRTGINEGSVDISSLEEGMYFIQFQADSETIMHRFIKE